MSVPVYPVLSVLAALAVVGIELRVARTGIFRDVTYWITMVICFAFMVPVDGWLTKLSAPIVRYDDAHTTGLRPVWDILAEEHVYAFALLTAVLMTWDWLGRRERERAPGHNSERPAHDGRRGVEPASARGAGR